MLFFSLKVLVTLTASQIEPLCGTRGRNRRSAGGPITIYFDRALLSKIINNSTDLISKVSNTWSSSGQFLFPHFITYFISLSYWCFLCTVILLMTCLYTFTERRNYFRHSVKVYNHVMKNTPIISTIHISPVYHFQRTQLRILDVSVQEETDEYVYNISSSPVNRWLMLLTGLIIVAAIATIVCIIGKRALATKRWITSMMMSWYRNDFRIIGSLWEGNLPVISRTKVNNVVKLWCFIGNGMNELLNKLFIWRVFETP